MKDRIHHTTPPWLAAVLVVLVGCSSHSGTGRAPPDGGGLRDAVQTAPRQAIDPALEHLSSALHHFLLGQLAYSQEDYAQAMANFSAADSLVPGGIPWLSARLAELHVKEGQLPQALVESEKALASSAADTRTLLLHAGILEGLGRVAEAEPIYDRVIREQPDNVDAYILLASVYAKRGDPAKAETLLRGIPPAVGESSAMVHYYLGRVQEMRSDFVAAERSYRRVRELEPENAAVAIELLRVLLKLKKMPETKVLAESILETDAHNQIARRVLASMALGERNLDEALAHFQILEAVEPDPIETRFKIALIQIEKQNFDEAARELMLVLAQKPRHSVARYYLASLYAGAGRRKEAAEELLSMMPEDEMYLKGRLLAAFLLRQIGDFGRARSAAEVVVAASPQDYNAIAALVAILRDQREYARALTVLATAASQGVQPEKIQFLKGLVLDEQGDRDAAIGAMEAVLAMNPRHGDALNYVAFSLAEAKRDLGRALELAERAVSLAPNDGFYLDTLGWVYFHSGDLERAELTLERAATLQPGDVVIQEHFGAVLEARGKSDRAREVYERAVKAIVGEVGPDDAAALERIKLKLSEQHGR